MYGCDDEVVDESSMHATFPPTAPAKFFHPFSDPIVHWALFLRMRV